VPKGLVVIVHPFAVAGTVQQVELARLAGELVETPSLVGRIEIVLGSMGDEERPRGDPPNEMFNGEAQQLLARLAGDRESETGVLGELRLDVVAGRPSKPDNLKGGD
jgi:hypothetical protein